MEDLSEKEQLEALRAWWSEYGTYVMGGIIAGVAIIVGLSQYRSYNVNVQTEASVAYEAVFEAVAEGNLEEAEAAASTLFADYGSTVYPAQGRLAMARLYMDKGRDQDAAEALKAVISDQDDSELGLIATLRLAKVYLYQNKASDVVTLLAAAKESAFTARFSEARGDAYVMLEKYEDARDAYLRAIADNDNPQMQTVDHVLVQMKIDDLPAAITVAADSTATKSAADAAVAIDPASDALDGATDESAANEATDADETAAEESSAADAEPSE